MNGAVEKVEKNKKSEWKKQREKVSSALLFWHFFSVWDSAYQKKKKK
jgi:hypothetical protein